MINTHPDYMRTRPGTCLAEEYPMDNYREFLRYVTEKYDGEYWNAVPRDVASYINALRNTIIRVQNKG